MNTSKAHRRIIHIATAISPSQCSAGGPPFKKVLVVNRGEIAIRIMRAAKEMGIATVAIFAAADADALHHTVARPLVPEANFGLHLHTASVLWSRPNLSTAFPAQFS